ncbi:hypothetical protein HN011_011001, partial [Eciton burchellii]
MCATESLEKQIFSKIFPEAHHFLLEILEYIDGTITDNNININYLDDVKRKLYISDGLLTFWEKCLEYVATLNKVRACYIISLCDILPETIKIIFKHCKASSKYGVLLSGIIQELRNLFIKANSIFKLFFTILDNIIFDMNIQSEIELLIKVIEAYGDIASIANGMDTKTFVEMTEAFAKLAIIHQKNIKLCNMTMHLDRIAKDISYFLSINKKQENSNMDRTMMAITRLLKTLEKLMTIYGALFTYETISNLIEFLMQMHGYLYLNFNKDGEKTYPISIVSFLDIIFDHNDFKQ